jgi:hypothetical protein
MDNEKTIGTNGNIWEHRDRYSYFTEVAPWYWIDWKSFYDSYSCEPNAKYECSFNLLNSKQTAGLFKRRATYTLKQIEVMNKISVNSRGVISQFKNGGYVINQIHDSDAESLSDNIKENYSLYKRGGKNVVISIIDIKENDNYSGGFGYNDWQYPCFQDLESASVLFKEGIGYISGCDIFFPFKSKSFDIQKGETPYCVNAVDKIYKIYFYQLGSVFPFESINRHQYIGRLIPKENRLDKLNEIEELFKTNKIKCRRIRFY